MSAPQGITDTHKEQPSTRVVALLEEQQRKAAELMCSEASVGV
jgi:hypothetical protein